MATIVCDLDGVVYVGQEPVPGASETLALLKAQGHQLLFATNNATRSPSQLVVAIEAASGFRPDVDSIVSSPMAAALVLEGRATTVFVVGEAGLSETLADYGIREVGPDEAEAVVVGLDRALTYDKLRDATLAIRRGALFIATNLDTTYPTPSGLWPGGGAVVAALAAASDTDPELAGKPAEPMRRLLRAKIAQEVVWVVGDRPDTDLALGDSEGWNTALVLTGVTAASDAVVPRPTAVLDSIAQLPTVL